MSKHEEELSQVVSAIEIVSPALLMFAGKPIAVAETVQTTAPLSAQASPVVAQLQNTLYQECYCRRFSLAQRGPVLTAVLPDPGFVTLLSQSNASTSRWDAGWQVRRIENTGQIWAEKAGVVRILQPGEYMNFKGQGTQLKKDDSVSYYVTRESTAVQPGMYFAFGETVMASDPLDVVRFYWNMEKDGVQRLLQVITSTLNRFQVPFQFKCSIYPQGFDRRDSAVLYVHKRFHSIVRGLIGAWVEECGPHLRDDVPLFTLPVGKGVGLAEDPGTGESFGMNRCRHVAEALWNAYSGGLTRQAYLPELEQHFRKHGLDPARLYLNAGSVDYYSLHAA